MDYATNALYMLTGNWTMSNYSSSVLKDIKRIVSLQKGEETSCEIQNYCKAIAKSVSFNLISVGNA
jgi:hypothetical protein